MHACTCVHALSSPRSWFSLEFAKGRCHRLAFAQTRVCKCSRRSCHRLQARRLCIEGRIHWDGLAKSLVTAAFQFEWFTALQTALTAFLPATWSLTMMPVSTAAASMFGAGPALYCAPTLQPTLSLCAISRCWNLDREWAFAVCLPHSHDLELNPWQCARSFRCSTAFGSRFALFTQCHV